MGARNRHSARRRNRLFFICEKIETGNHPPPPALTKTIPSLSADRKNIIVNGNSALAIDDNAIVDFFRKRFLCTPENITSTPDRKMFCEDRATLKKLTRFVSIVVSPDAQKVGFIIESDTLAPDTVIGIFYPSRATDRVHFLTEYYLGNTLISFSPNSARLIRQSDCFEGLCGLIVNDAETLADQREINNPGLGTDGRSENAEFVRWVSDNEVEYTLGATVQHMQIVDPAPGWTRHHNGQHRYAFSYPEKQIKMLEVPMTKNHDLFEVYFLWPQTGNPIGGVRIFPSIPSTAFSNKSLTDYIHKGGSGWEQSFSPMVGYREWQCRDGENQGGDTIRSCYTQWGDTVYVFDYNDAFHSVLSREDFDRVVRSFHLTAAPFTE